MFIVHAYDLNEDIERYKELFPESYTSYDAVKEKLRTRMDDPVGAKFGIEVSSEWQDKCFGFEVDSKHQRRHISFTWVHGKLKTGMI